MTSDVGTCGLCRAVVPLERFIDHLRDEHGIDDPPATWPDGEVVVIDNTLNPEDFNAA